ncbi:hypothetical protein GCM10008960_21040 [Deinococcus sedimenti]|uniref:Uncharacterized protein n=1 Tax=Deinococcus sedimenti TaxID=1867090 RepID=A0ABQ2S3U7_9DEIO|nr:hypothetical protein GCM10008960_21040 [Deinococcus sedimenti]
MSHSEWADQLGSRHTDLTKQQLIRSPGFEVLHPTGTLRVDTFRVVLKRTGWHVTHQPRRWIGMGEADPFTLRKKSLELNFICDQRYHRFVRYRWLAEGPSPDLEGATWADLDRRGRLLIARAGRVFIWRGGQEAELADLNADQPPRPAQPA